MHKEVKAGWYIEVGSLHRETYIDGVKREKGIRNGLAIEEYITPVGNLQMIRKWNPISFSWDVKKRMVESLEDLKNSHLCRVKTSIRALL